MFQIQDQSMRPLTTAHLAQTMSLLNLSNTELHEKVISELAANPALELVDERVCPSCGRKLAGSAPCPVCSRKQKDDEPIVFMSPRDSYRPHTPNRDLEDAFDLEPAAPENLAAHVLQQLASDLKEEDRQLAYYILSSLDDDGFLTEQPVLIARTTRRPLSSVQEVIHLISHVDPPGLAAAGPRDALLIQLDMLPECEARSLAGAMIQSHFKALGRREFEKIASSLDVSLPQVRRVVTFIQENLNPYPARAFWGSGRSAPESDPNVFHAPDVLIHHSRSDKNGPLLVEIFAPVSGWLRVNPLFRKAMKTKDKDASEAWNQHLEKATLFVKCIQQRNNTMQRLMSILVSTQQEFILNGDRHLIPMTRAKLAEELDVHESTISRAVANKAVALPDGRMIPLSRFFDRSLSVRDRIKEIVSEETKPLTDEQISSLLEEDGIHVARRTVAKYRTIEGILPARLRQQKKAQAPMKA